MKRKKLTSKRAVGDEFFLSATNLLEYRIQLKKWLVFLPIKEMFSTDEVAVL